MANYNTLQTDSGSGFDPNKPVGYSNEQWAAVKQAARNSYNTHLSGYNTCLNRIVELNVQLVYISSIKAKLSNCKMNIISADSLLGEIRDNNISTDYGTNFHPTIEKLTEKSEGKVCGFEESIDNLNAAKDKIKIDLDSLGSEIDSHYNTMNNLNYNYHLGYVLPDRTKTYDLLEKGLNA